MPTTGMAEMILMHDSCRWGQGCWASMNSRWTPNWDEPIGGIDVPFTPKEFEFIYKYRQTKVKT